VEVAAFNFFWYMNEKVMRRLLRAAAWIIIIGALIGALFQWTAICRGYTSTDAALRIQMRDAALTVSVFWGMLWVGLPLMVWTFRRFMGKLERYFSALLVLVMLVGTAVALRMG
jgi:hypothetical protein